ncbi:hypothetical protein, partial [Halorubrum sp. SP9]
TDRWNENDIHDGERYARSPLTDAYYRVTRWERIDEEKIRAIGKTEVEREDVPSEWLEVLDDAKMD